MFDVHLLNNSIPDPDAVTLALGGVDIDISLGSYHILWKCAVRNGRNIYMGEQMLKTKSTILLVLLFLTILANPADAKPEFMSWFGEQYPDSIMKNNCGICHDTSYAQGWTLAGRNVTAIENLDSDGDGILNIDEIEAGKNPGVPEAYSYYLPNFIGHTNHWTGIGLRNCSPDTAATVTVFVYDSNGNVSESKTISIVARGHDVFTIGTGQLNEGWIRITSTQPLVELCFVATTGEPDYMADIPFASELSTLLIVPHIGQGPVYDTIVSEKRRILFLCGYQRRYTSLIRPGIANMFDTPGAFSISAYKIAGIIRLLWI